MNRYISIMIALAMCAVSAIAEIESGFGNEEIVDCNGGDGWIAWTSRPYPDGYAYYATIKDTSSFKRVYIPPRVRPARRRGGAMGYWKEVGDMEWRGHKVKEISVEVQRKGCEVFAYKKIHELLKAKTKCSLTILCDEKRPWQTRLVGAEFPDVGKTFAEGEDGKIKEVKPSDK